MSQLVLIMTKSLIDFAYITLSPFTQCWYHLKLYKSITDMPPIHTVGIGNQNSCPFLQAPFPLLSISSLLYSPIRRLNAGTQIPENGMKL